MNRHQLTDLERSKIDESDDSKFYLYPRFVYHFDGKFRKRLINLYSDLLQEDSVILDLMSSWDSHLPNINFKRVIGHGLNLEELKRNKSLDSYWIQDLNRYQKLPLEDNSLDFCLLVAGWQYLQYPERIATEIFRVIKPGGKFIISFTNKAFWTKSPNIWVESSEEKRIDYVSNTLINSNWKIDTVISEQSENNYLFKLLSTNCDPFYSIIAIRY
tara:strand:+ start:108 stop:752 length:645 start_codon:yes stop_codon:yes gene_type:complete